MPDHHPDPQALDALGVTLHARTGAPDGRWYGTVAGGEVVVDVVGTGGVQPAAVCRRAAALASLEHRSLARVLGAAPGARGVVTAQHRVRGPDLATLLQGRVRWTPREVLGVVLDLLEALAVLHEAGLAHGDVAPANVLIRPEGTPVLVDLLLGATAGERGTPGWAAPERRDGVVGAAGDVYAVARLGQALLDRTDGDPATASRLREALDQGTASEPAGRPTAARLARALRGVATPERWVVPDVAHLVGAEVRREALADVTHRVPRRPRGRHRRVSPWRTATAPGVLGVLVLGSAVAVSLHTAPAGPASAGSVSAGPASGVPASGREVRAGTGAAVGGSAVDAPGVPVGPGTPGRPGAGGQGPLAPGAGPEGAARAAVSLTHRRAAAVHDGRLLAQLSVTAKGWPAGPADAVPPARRGERPALVVEAVGPARETQDSWWVPLTVRAGEQAGQTVHLEVVVEDGAWRVRAVRAVVDG